MSAHFIALWSADNAGLAGSVRRTLRALRRSRWPGARSEPSVAVDILSIATATPEYKITQAEALSRVNRVSSIFARLSAIYTNSGIETRYSCVPPEWCERHHGWEERMDVYQRHALELLEKVARKSVAAAGLSLPDIDVIVTNSTTGLAVPSIDALLISPGSHSGKP